MTSYAEAVYFATYSSNCTMPAPQAYSSPSVAEATYWAGYNSNCTFPSQPTAASSGPVVSGDSARAMARAKSQNVTEGESKDVVKDVAPPQLPPRKGHIPHTVPMETPHAVPTGVMTVKEFIHNMWVSLKNLAVDNLPTGVMGTKTIEVNELDGSKT